MEDSRQQADLLARLAASTEQGGSLEVRQLETLEELDGWLPAGDILLADIELGGQFGGQSGIDLVKTRLAGTSTQVIYVTGHVKYCTPVYETPHVYFLLKPVKPQELQMAFNRAIANIEKSRGERLVLTSGGNVASLQPRDIRFIESDRRKVRVYTADGVVEAYASLAGLIERLPASFISCHKSFLVNMDYIREVGKDGIHLHSGETVPVSRQKRTEVKRALLSHLGAGF